MGEAPRYPNVYLASQSAGTSIGGQKLLLPLGTTKETKEVRTKSTAGDTWLLKRLTRAAFGQLYEEVTIPAPKAVPFRFNETLRPISEMDPWGRRTFHVSVIFH